MNSLLSLSVAQLRKVIAIKEKIEALDNELQSVLNVAPQAGKLSVGMGRKKRTMSAAVRAKMAAARRAWWAKRKKTATAQPVKKSGRISAAGKRRLSMVATARWAKIKAAGRKSLKVS